jgi:hypothetical protein
MVTPEAWAVNAAVHAASAFACALDPPEVMVPVSEGSTFAAATGAEALGVELDVEGEPEPPDEHAVSESAAAATTATPTA